MNSRKPIDIDAAIEAALSGEPMRTAPETLHRRVEERLRIVRLKDQEQSRFRYTMSTMAVGFLVVLAMTGLIVSVTNFYVLILHGVSGGKGQYDAYATSWLISASGYSGAYSLLSSLLLGLGTFIVALIPLWKYFSRGHAQKF